MIQRPLPTFGFTALFLLLPRSAYAEEAAGGALSSHFRIDDRDPESNLPSAEEANKRPLEFGYFLVDLEERAQKAAEAGDHRKAVSYHRALARLVPDRATAFGALCRDYEQLGDRAHALAACRDALGRPGVKVEDHLRFVRIVANRPGDLDAKELEDAQAVIEHLKQVDSARLAAYQLQCELSMRSGDRAALADCADRLEQLATDDPKHIPFAWSVAMHAGDEERARTLIASARQKGLAAEALARMEAAMNETSKRSAHDDSGAFTPRSETQPLLRWLLGLVTVALIGVLLARRITRASSP